MMTTEVSTAATLSLTVHRLRSSSPKPWDCICCDGPHIIGTSLDLDANSASPPLSQFANHRNLSSWLDWVLLAHMPDGARVRISVEVE